jgi:hypothetical protein
MNDSMNNLLTSGFFLVGQAVAAAATIILKDSLNDESEVGHHKAKKHGGSKKGYKARQRIRRTIEEIHVILGDLYFRRAYRMSIESFWELHEQLRNGIEAAASTFRRRRRANHNNNHRRPPVPNGQIPSSVRLGCALRYFGGGSPYDLMVIFGISHTEVLSSVWIVVEAVNKHAPFFIEYPADHEKQKEIASAFYNASSAGFDSCAGAIDGILIWTQKPSEKEAAKCGLGRKKFLCGRKNKFGLNCQAVSDCRGKFLDISILYGGSSSDCLAFEASTLYNRLEYNHILAPGLSLFGDNAYLNATYMATPYTNVSHGSKDDYNFFHSQLRIRIECAFGMLVHRWAILQTALPCGISIQRTIALVNALAKLHNFCIERNEMNSVESSIDDRFRIENNELGFVPLEETNNCDVAVPLQLLDGGNHLDDISRLERRRHDRNTTQNLDGGLVLPREKLLCHVIDKHVARPKAII